MRSLYLDTARLGQTTPSALKTQIDFARLTAEEPSSLYFDKFLRDGSNAWPTRYRERFPGLLTWQGIAELKQSLRNVVAAPPDCRVLLANRSAQLMQLSARVLFRQCRNVLTTDSSWPSYRSLLTLVAGETDGRVTSVPLRRSILRDGMTQDEIVNKLTTEYLAAGCDGLFLPAIDNLGTRIPIKETVESIRRRSEVRFVVVDGAQTFCHAPFTFQPDVCDIFLAGCHKWLRGYHPMGVAFFGRERSRDAVDRYSVSMLATRKIDDPLLRFSQQLETGVTDGFSETVSILPLFSCRAALADSEQSSVKRRQVAVNRRWNADRLASAITRTGWKPLRPALDLRTGILLLQHQRSTFSRSCPDVIRAAFQRAGLILTAYRRGIIRLSMPDATFSSCDVGHACKALTEVN